MKIEVERISPALFKWTMKEAKERGPNKASLTPVAAEALLPPR